MSFQTFRKSTSSPQNERIKKLLQRLDKFQRDQNPLDDNTLKALGFTDRGLISYHDELAFTKISTVSEDSHLVCIEPDGNLLKLWYTFDGLTELEDRALFGNTGQVIGNYGCGNLEEGLDEGFGAGGNMCMKFDGTSRYIKTSGNTSIDANDSTGFSIFFRFKTSNLTGSMVLFEKIESDVPNYGYKANLINTSLIFSVAYNGTFYRVSTGSGVISADTWYDCWFIFNAATTTPVIYVNNSSYSTGLVDFGFSSYGFSGGGFMVFDEHIDFGSLTLNGTDLIIGNGIDLDSYFSGNIQDFRFWNGKVISSTEVSRMWTNKLTISNIPYGETVVVSYSIIPAAKKRSLSETVSISEQLTVTKIFSNPIIVPVTDTAISISDQVTPLKNPIIPRTVSESVNVSESLSVQKFSLQAKVGSITKDTSTSGLPKTISYSTEVGFTPKFMIFFGTSNTSYGSFNPDHRFFIGFSDGTNHRSVGVAAQDNAASSDTYRSARTNTITYVDYNGNVESLSSCAFTTNGFNITYTNNNNSAKVLNYIALGGSTLTNAKVGDFTEPTTTTGNNAVTGVGFLPDLNLFLSTDKTGLDSESADSYINFSVGKSSSERFSISANENDAQSVTDSYRIARDDRALHEVSPNNGSVRKSADFVSNDSDGFTLNYITASGSANKCIYASLKGINCKLGKISITTGTGLLSVTGIGFKPKLVIFAGHGKDLENSDTPSAEYKFNFGAATGSTARRAISVHSKDNESDSIAVDRSESSKCYTMITAAASSSSSINEFQMDLVSMDTDGFTINRTTNTGITQDILYIAIA